MIYLASPYTHTDPLIMKTRFLVAEQCTARLLQQGQFVYSPIVHCHEIALKYDMPTTFDFWRRYNFDMLRRADLFGILKIKGWDQSHGVEEEHRMARDLGMTIYFLDEEGRALVGGDD